MERYYTFDECQLVPYTNNSIQRTSISIHALDNINMIEMIRIGSMKTQSIRFLLLIGDPQFGQNRIQSRCHFRFVRAERSKVAVGRLSWVTNIHHQSFRWSALTRVV